MDENWDFATYVVSHTSKPDALINGLADRMKREAVLVVTDDPAVAGSLVEAMAMFIAELPADVVKSTLDRLADDERLSLGLPPDDVPDL